MYKQLVANDFFKVLKLPVDYKVSGFLCHGTWKREEEIENIKEILSGLGVNYKIKTLTGFLQRMVEIEVGDRKIWFDFPYGGAMLSEYLHLACLFGSKKNILIGSCGGLSPKAETGDCIIPTWVYGDESSTRMYSEENSNNRYFSDPDLSESLRQRLNSSIKVWQEPTTTCQAMLAETWENVVSWSKEGYFGVEMEASTVFAVSNHFKIPSAAMLVVGDNLIKEETILHENFQKSGNRRWEVRKELLKTALEEMLND